MGNSSSSSGNSGPSGGYNDNEQLFTQADIDEKNNKISQLYQEIEQLESDLAELTATNSSIDGLNSEIAQLRADLAAKDARITELQGKDDTIAELDAQKTAAESTVAGKDDTIKQLTDELAEKKNELANLESDLSSASSTISARDNTITKLNNDIATYKSCEDINDKLIIALRKYQSGTGFVKLLFDNKDWLMYIVDDFDKNWKNHKWFKYLWNIAFTFKNTSRVIIIFGARNNAISPVRSPANFKGINKCFIDALAVDSQLTANNMDTVITNPLLASKYNISFWGAYRQRKGDSGDYTYIRTLEHDQIGKTRHGNRNQTAWMWNWINTTVYDPKKYPSVKATDAEIKAFNDKGRIVGRVSVNNTNRNSSPNVTNVYGFYAQRPTAAGG